MKKLCTSLFIALLIHTYSNAQSATFNVTYNGFSPEAQDAFAYATGLWGSYLDSDVPIEVVVHYQPLLPGTLAITFPNGVFNAAGGPVPDVWYASSLANAMSGTDQKPGEADMEIYINSTITWYFGTDGSCPAGSYDFVTVAFHEMCHGLGFLSLANINGDKGAFGIIDATEFSPLTTSFPWPDLDTMPSILDTYLVTGAGIQLITVDNPSMNLGTDFTSGDIFLNDPSAVAANGGTNPKIYAPATFVLGSSITHLDEATFPAGSENELMTPNGTSGGSNHEPGGIVLGVLSDMGWEVHSAAITDLQNTSGIKIFPQPANDMLTLQWTDTGNEVSSIILYDLTGNKILEKNYQSAAGENSLQLDVSLLPPGIYAVTLGRKSFLVSIG